MFFDRKFERGQILLVVVLSAVIALTVGLAAISRTITNTKVTTEEENSQKALSAAEAGVEQVAAGAAGSGTFSNNAKFDAKATALAVGNSYALNGGAPLSQDDGADIWLSTYPDYTAPQWSGTLTVYWEQKACSNEAAIEVVVISGASTASPNLTRYAADRCRTSRTANNNFSAPNAVTQTISGVTYNNSITVPVISGFIARVIPIYNSTKVAVGKLSSDPAFPSQGNIITSTGASGNTKRTVQVVKGYPRVPIEFFPYNLFLP